MSIKEFDGNTILLLWIFIFLIPIPISILLDTNIGIRNFNYLGTAIMLVWSVANHHKIVAHQISFKPRLVVLFWIVLFLSFQYAYFSKFYSLHLNVFDFGIFQSMLEAISNHHFGYSNVVGFYHFGTHQNYILVLILPLYQIFHNVEILLFIGAMTIWATAFVLWLIAKELNLDKFLSFFISLTFALSPLNGLDNSFQPELFTPLFLALIYLFYLKRYWLWFCICVLLAISTKEDAVLFVAGLGVVMLFRKHYRYGIVAILCSSAMLILNLCIVQPYFVAKSGMYQPTTLNFWRDYGSNKIEIILNFITHPIKVAGSIFSLDSGFWRLYATLLFIPLLFPEVIFTSIITIIMWGTSGFFWQHQYKSYYALNLNIMVFIAVILFFSGKSWFTSKYITRYHVKWYKMTSYLLFICLVLFPLWGTGWQSFWGINFQQVINAKKLATKIKQEYPNKLVCPSSTMYQFLIASDLPLATFNIKGKDNQLDYQKFFSRDCLYVISTIGDNYPFTPQQIQVKLNTMNCQIYQHNFYLCLHRK